MKKLKCFLIVIMVFLVSVSCIDDNDFNSLVDTWEYQALSNDPNGPSDPSAALFKGPPPLSDGCISGIKITFDKDLTGILELEKYCDSETGIEEVGFDWNIKNDQLTMTFDPQNENNWELISNMNTFAIFGDQLIITNEYGISTEFLRFTDPDPVPVYAP